MKRSLRSDAVAKEAAVKAFKQLRGVIAQAEKKEIVDMLKDKKNSDIM